MMNDILVDVRNLSITIDTFRGPLRIIRNQDIMLRKGEILGVVGESGCGKSVMVNSLMGLLPEGRTKIKSEKFEIDGEDCQDYVEEDWNELRGTTVAMVFQDPMTALNPTMTIGRQIEEAIKIHNPHIKRDALEKRVIELMGLVGIDQADERRNLYPYHFSGGMRQRSVLAIALAGNPSILIADEPTTALDVTIQAQILDLMRDLQKKIKTSIIIITHNLGVVANIADRVAVMYGGKLVETGDVEDIFHNPCHEYTKGLLRSIPKAHEKGGELQAIPGTPPDLMEPPVGCPFAARCKETMIVCQKYMPDYTDCGKNHKSACWMLDEMAQEVNSDEK